MRNNPSGLTSPPSGLVHIRRCVLNTVGKSRQVFIYWCQVGTVFLPFIVHSAVSIQISVGTVNLCTCFYSPDFFWLKCHFEQCESKQNVTSGPRIEQGCQKTTVSFRFLTFILSIQDIMSTRCLDREHLFQWITLKHPCPGFLFVFLWYLCQCGK